LIPENSFTNVPDEMSVTPEEQSESLTVTCEEVSEEGFVGEFRLVSRDSRQAGGIGRFLWRQR